MAVLLQQHGQSFGGVEVVLDSRYPPRGDARRGDGGGGGGDASTGAALNGSSTVKVLPMPMPSLRTPQRAIVHLHQRARQRQADAQARPAPQCRGRLQALGEQIEDERLHGSAAMPMPWSRTVTCAILPATCARSAETGWLRSPAKTWTRC